MRLRNEQLHNLYAVTNIIRVIKLRKAGWVRYVACMGEMRNAYTILVRKPEGNIPPRRPRRKWKDFRLYLRETGWEGVDLSHVAQYEDKSWSLVNTVMEKAGNFLTSSVTVSLSRTLFRGVWRK
jgi:hypothetical protein